MTIEYCLNCEQKVSGNFCSNCGQSTHTHRYSLHHFFVHDFIHGIFHFDNGFFYTIKELFTRPGHSIREFIQGKRVKHFNFFAMVIILLALNYFLSKWTKTELTDVFNKESVSGLSKVIKGYSKLATFLIIPINALLSFFIFRKSRQNYTENLVLNIYLLAGIISFRAILYLTMIVTNDVEVIRATNLVVVFLIFAYTAIFFYQYFSAYSSNRINLVLRVLLISVLFIITKQGINNLINEIGIKYLH
ncbi:DUF3667 domain-containing protein [Flavobacterium foetidum]|uniref:DUF3667 domain-containing protein n=1 Tax=Flavobacterium foetidum TaxID=2026681 RepID=UPI001075216C|nr:DUF3667 domain-containing protein [Flavobacterium foetidum]KAF2515229.1 DUF3667 domain-containing protein [Flavobacterium foetidum]